MEQVAMVILKDVHPLYGGRNLYLRRDGSGFCQIVLRRPGVPRLFERRYPVSLPADAMQDLFHLISSHSFAPAGTSLKPALPDSAKPSISIGLTSGHSITVSKSPPDKDADFDAIYRALLRIAASVQSGKGSDEMEYDPKFRREEFLVK